MSSWNVSRIAGLLVVIVSLAATGPGGEMRAAQTPDLDGIMREKLEHGQRLLAAVVLGQSVAVERSARELTLLSEASTWTPLRTTEYLQYAAAFRDTAERLMLDARDRDQEGMAFAYTELVTTCVQCHRHVRGAAAAD